MLNGNHKTRFLALLLCAVMAVGNGEGVLTAAAAEWEEIPVEVMAEELPEEEEVIPVAELPDENAEEEAETAEEPMEEPEVMVAPAEETPAEEPAPAEAAPVTEEAAEAAAPEDTKETTPSVAAPAVSTPAKATKAALPAKGTVSGFDFSQELTELTVPATDRPAEQELVKRMPATLSVYLGQSNAPVELPVTWYCVTGDYAKGQQSYFQFSPKWDTKAYPLAKGLDVETDAPCVGVFVSESSTISTLSVTKSGNESAVYRFLIKNMGLSCAAASGIMANIQCECGFNPKVVGHGSATFHGLCQWGQGGSTGNRWNKLKKWCKAQGYSYKSVTGQLMYMKHELETVQRYGYASLKKVPNSATGANKAARIFAKNFEGCSSKYFRTRQRLAQSKYWKEYSPLALAKVTVVQPDIYYDGEAKKPQLLVTRGDTTLKQDKDYQVSYSNNVLADLGVFEITGLGKYSGILLGTFHIKIKNQSPHLTDVTGVSTGIKVSWEPVAGAVRYRVYRKKASSWVKVGDTANLSLVDTGAVSGSVNTYAVRCISNDGQPVSDYSAESMSLDYVAAPALTAAVSNEGIRLKWNPVVGASLYRILRKNADGEWEELTTTASTSFTDKKAPMSKTSSYQAVSLSKEEEVLSCRSGVQSLRLMPVPVLKKAKGVYKGIQVSWKKVPGAAKYRIYRKKGSIWEKIADTTSTSYKDKSVKKKKKYTYTVACVSKDGKAVESFYSTKGVTGKRKK